MSKATVRDYRQVFETEQGQKVIKDLMGYSGMAVAGQLNTETLAFREGAKSIVLYVLAKTKGLDSETLLLKAAEEELNQLDETI